MDMLVIGEVLRPQGLRGEVKILPLTDDPARYHSLSRVYCGDAPLPISVSRIHDGFVYAVIGDAASREDAEKLRGQTLRIPREEAVPLAEGHHFIVDLIGIEVFTDTGDALGVIREVVQPGANDVYVLRGPRGEVLLPALKKLVLDVDIAGKRMTVDSSVLEEVAVFAD